MPWWIVSYVVGNWSLILCVVLIVAALIAVGILSKNWKALVAAGIVVAAGFAYQWIDRNAYQRAQAEQLADTIKAKDAQIEAIELRLHTVNAANELLAMQSAADANTITELEAEADETPPNATIALDRDAARRVRDFRRRALGNATAPKSRPAAGAGQHSGVLPVWKWAR